MKKILLFLSAWPLIVVAQNSYTISNIAGVTANYASLQGALDSVPDGSILYLFPSTVSYGGAVVKKKVAIYGTGFLLEQNAPPATTPNTYGVNLQYLDIKQGGSSSYIEGIQFNNINFAQVPTLPVGTPLQIDSAANVIISRCGFFPHGGGYFITTNTTYNTIIRDSYFDLNESGEGNNSNMLNDNSSGSTGLQFRNNIITNRRVNMGFGAYNILPNSDISFINNTFVVRMASSNFQNMKYVNNIFVDTDTTAAVSPASVYLNGEVHHNVTNRTTLFSPQSFNTQGINPDSVFVYSGFGFFSEDQQWQLRSNSFVNTYATDGLACGAYGGDNPYTLSGIPHLPNIYSLTIARDTTKRGNVLVHIKAKASN